VFLPSLLAREEVAVLGAFDAAERIVAGVIANRSERVVGVTNFFAEARAEEALRASIEAATGAFPGVPVVGWAAGAELAALKRIGFRGCGRLAVWVRARSPG
jgi:hypothetical protein